MAFTYVYGNNIKPSNYNFYFKSFLGYEIITNDSTTYKVRVHAGVCLTTSGQVGWGGLQVTLASSLTPNSGTIPGTITGDYRSKNSMGGSDQKVVYVPTLNNNTSYIDLTWNKTTAAQTLKLTASLYKSNLSSGTKSIATLNLTIPAKPSYSIIYNPNGGSGSVITDTKWYGANHTIRAASTYTRTNYTLSKWNTAANGSGTSYNCGATYSNNAGITLYAQWTLNYASPTMGSTSIYRANSSGGADDTGTYIAINAFTYGGGKVGSTQYKPFIKIEINGTVKYGPTQQSAVSGTFPKVTYGTYAAESVHTVKITIYDTNYTDYQKVYTVTIPTATYPIDLKVNGTKVNMGIMTTAVGNSGANNLTLLGFTATGASTINGALTVSSLTSNGAISCTNLTGSGQVQGATLKSTGNTTVGGALTTTGNATINGTLTAGTLGFVKAITAGQSYARGTTMGTITKTVTITKAGFITLSAGTICEENHSDTGTWYVGIAHNGTLRAGSGGRFTGSITPAIGGSATVNLAVANGDKLVITFINTKTSKKRWDITGLCFNCTATIA